MNSSQIFTGRAFINEEKAIDLLDKRYGKIFHAILSKAKQTLDIVEIKQIKGDENFDCFMVKTGFIPMITTLKIKISYDKNCKSIISETVFLRANDAILNERIIDSGIVEVGTKIRYIITAVDRADTLEELGRGYLFDNMKSFMYTFVYFSSLNCDVTFEEYFSNFLKEKDFSDSSEYVSEMLEINYGLENVLNVFEDLKNKAKENYKGSLLSAETACHGNLSLDNIISREFLFKFIDCQQCFLGNKLLDICFLCLNLGLSKNVSKIIVGEYSMAFDLDEEKVQEEFLDCMKVAAPMFFMKILHSYVIESCVFLGERKDSVLELVSKFSRSFDWLLFIGIKEENLFLIKSILLEPILGDSSKALEVPSEIESKDRRTKPTQAKKPILKTEFKRSESGSAYIKISWEKISSHNNYLCYVRKPNGFFKKYKESQKTTYIYDDLDLIGVYGIGVRSIGDKNSDDSDFDIATVEVFDI